LLGRRLSPSGALGLTLTIQLGLLALGGWAFGTVLQDVLGRGDVARFDRPITSYVVDHRTAWLTIAMRAVTTLGSTAVLIPVIAVTGASFKLRRGTWTPLALLAIAQLGSIALYDTVKVLVARPRPAVGHLVATATGYAFPSGHATQAVAVWGAIALLLIPTVSNRTGKIAGGAAAAVIAMLVGVSRVYLGVHWSTDVLGGWALGALWLTVLVVSRPQSVASAARPAAPDRSTPAPT
jgi:undecaprenyl-diphosphatase